MRTSIPINRVGIILVVLACFSLLSPAHAQKVILSQESYEQPEKEIADLVTAPWYLNVTLRDLGPDKEHFLYDIDAGLPTLQQFAKPFVNLGEIEFDHTANRSRNFTIRRSASLELLNYKTGGKIAIPAPPGRWVSAAGRGGRPGRAAGSPVVWSPDGSKIAYFAHSESDTHIFIADASTGQSRQLTKTPVLATLVTHLEWTPDGNHILTVLIPGNRAPMPQESKVAEGPQVRMNDRGETPNRTYRFLMETPYDMEMLEWLATGQLALVNSATGEVRALGKPDMHQGFSISPDGKYIHVTTLQKPFSYHVPVSSFGTLESIIDLDGKQVAEVQKVKLRTSTVRRGAAPGGGRGDDSDRDKRNVTWRPDGRGLSFLQREPRKAGPGQGQESEEGSQEEAKRKDRVMHWLPPFDQNSLKVLYETENRLGGVEYSEDGETVFVTETEEGTEHLFALKASDLKTPHTIYKHKTSDVYSDPGSLMTREGGKGGQAVRMSSDGRFVYLQGTLYSKENVENAPRPFIHKVEIATGEKTPVFESEADVYEDVLTVADDDLKVIFTSREKPDLVPDCYVRDLASGTLKKLTENKDYAPEITAAKRMRFQVERVDGIKFWVDLTLPAGYVEGTRLPAMFWFYPREYTSQKNYDESTLRYNKNNFPQIGTRSMEILVKQGYAVVQPDCPIIGRQGQMNNNYVPDLRNNLWAVIDNLDKKGYIDRDRLGIGGHSYGAFGTANAMIQTPFFKAGIAGDGNYNRTLTPLTFQSERRLMWEAREVYLTMSPLLYADQLNGALLMYHGIDDANNGTFPINSDRMFHALNGLGKTVALYNYPYEHHGPATRETLLDLWARWTAWLDIYVKNPEKGKEAEKKVTTSNRER